MFLLHSEISFQGAIEMRLSAKPGELDNGWSLDTLTKFDSEGVSVENGGVE